jgi:hypothetical protein
MGTDQRKSPRASSYAKALLLEPQALGYVRDLSRSGCQVAFMQSVEVATGDLITLRIIAEHDPSLAPFELQLRVRWVKRDPLWFALGGEIDTIEDARGAEAFDRLVMYYTNGRG